MTIVLGKCRERSVMTFVFASDGDYAKPLINAGWDVLAVGTIAGWFSTVASDVRRRQPGHSIRARGPANKV
jgi:hypothetical protein